MRRNPATALKRILLAVIAVAAVASAAAQSDSLADIRALARESRYQEAHDRLETYLARRPQDEEARLLKGVLLTRLERIDEAIDAFLALARDNPDLAEPHNNLAVLYAAQGRYDEARSALEKAVRIKPDYATAHENLGDIYARLSHQQYMRAYRIDEGNARALDKATTVVNLFERISTGFAKSPPAAEPEVASASPPTPAPSAPPEPEPASGAAGEIVCFGVSGLGDEGDAAAVAAWLEQRGVEADWGTRAEKEFLNYQVYIPPLESRAAAKALIDELNAAGIVDLSLVYKGELTNGVSLGVYNSEKRAQRRIERLEQMGYEATYRHRTRTRQVPYVDATTLEGVVNENAFNQAFPAFGIVPAPCG